MSQRILVAGVGNLFLSDDGFGPEVVRLLAAAGDLPDGVRVVDYGIRGMQLVYDLLEGYDCLVLIDTIPGDGAPGQVAVLKVEPDDLSSGDVGGAGFNGHGMDPVAVLAGLTRLGGTLPATYVVGCQPGTVGDGIGQSDPVAAAIPVAMAKVRLLLDTPLMSPFGGVTGPADVGRA